MPDRYKQLETLINSLTDIQAEHRVDDLLVAAKAEPQSAEVRLNQVAKVLEAYQALGTGRGDARRLRNAIGGGSGDPPPIGLARREAAYRPPRLASSGSAVSRRPSSTSPSPPWDTSPRR